MNLSTLVIAAVTEGSVLDVAQQYDAIEVINRVIAYAIIVAGFLSVVFIFFGGISFILSGGQDDKIKQAVSTIRYAIVGLVVTMFSVAIVAIIGRAMGLNVIQYINLGEIFDLIANITSGADSGGPNGGSLD
jgi:cytochrome bd-type quinol oxidase subunit 2